MENPKTKEELDKLLPLDFSRYEGKKMELYTIHKNNSKYAITVIGRNPETTEEGQNFGNWPAHGILERFSATDSRKWTAIKPAKIIW